MNPMPCLRRGRKSMWTMDMCFTRYRKMPERMRSFSFMALDRAALALKLRRTEGKDSRRSFFVKDTKCTSWISQGGEEQEAAEWKER